MSSRDLLKTTKGRFTGFGLMYISEGIPYGFTSTAMVAFMRSEGISIEKIGIFVAALFIPWAFKWMIAPMVDLIKLNRIGGRKAWIVICTCLMILTLLITAAVDFKADFQILLMMVVLNNIFCATQDVAIDSLAVSTLKADERARGNGYMFGGQYLGIALGGGGAIFVYGALGFNYSLMYISSLLLLNLIFIIIFIQDPGVKEKPTEHNGSIIANLIRTLWLFTKEVYASFWQSGNAPKVGVLFSILPIGTMALGYAILGTIQVDYGLNQNQIALLSIYNTIAAALGCVIGGLLADKYGQKKMLSLYILLTVIPTLILAIEITNVGLVAVPIQLFYGVIISHGMFFGMTFGVTGAVFMGITNPAVAATQFTAFMALTNLAISMANYWQGVVAERIGYAMVFYIDSVLVLLPLAVIPFLRTREEEIAKINNKSFSTTEPAFATDG